MQDPGRASTIFHDARLTRIILSDGANLEAVFSHVDVYIPKLPGVFTVWSYRAKASATGVSDLRTVGSLTEAWVSDGDINGNSLIEFADPAQPATFGPVEVNMSFVCGAELSFRAETLEVQLGERLRKLEDFVE